MGPAAERDLRTVLEQVVACSSAGEPLRVWSLYAPAYLARLYQIQGPFTESMYSAYEKPLPDESRSGMQVAGIVGLWQSGDGRYGIEAIMRYPSVPMPKRLIFWCVNTSDGLRIEEVVGEISFSLP